MDSREGDVKAQQYRGYTIKTAMPTGGKAGKNHNVTTSLQVLQPTGAGYTIAKQIRVPVGDEAKLNQALEKARRFVDQQIEAAAATD